MIKVEDLTGKYEDALSTSNQYAKERDDYQKAAVSLPLKQNLLSDKYEQEKLTADRSTVKNLSIISYRA